MAIIIGRVKCCFCGEKDGLLHSVHQYGTYGEVGNRYFYHPECLEIRQIYPKRFDHRSVDMAIHIIDLLNENEKDFNEHIIDNYHKKAKTLERSLFERMIPPKTK